MPHEHDHEHEHIHDHEHDHPEVSDEEAGRKLRKLFERFVRPVEIWIFSDPEDRGPFARAAREVIEGLAELSDKVTAKRLPLDGDEAKKRGITASPTIVFDPGRVDIRWQGAPLGEEMRTLMETVIMLGLDTSGASGPSKKLLAKLDGPRAVKVFVSLTCPYCPQQAVNGVKAAMERPDLVSLTIVETQANPELANQYHAHSTPMTFVDQTLIGAGAQPEELFMASLVEMTEKTWFIPDEDAEEVACDLVVVGGGPAGLTAAIYGQRAGLETVVIEKGALGGQVAQTPEVENYPGLTQVGGKALVDLMVGHALEYARIFPGEEVMEIKAGEKLTVTTNRRRFLARAVLLATGATHRRLGSAGEDRLSGRGVSYCSTCDGPLFKGGKVLVVGGGDSAVTEALHLAHIGVGTTLVHRRDRLRAQEHLVQALDEAGVEVIYNAAVADIQGEDRVRRVVLNIGGTEERTLEVDGVFIAIGYDPQTALAAKLGLELAPDGYIRVDARHRTSLPGVYAAGDVEGGFKQIVTAAGRGAEAAMAVFEDLSNPYWKREKAD